jgi:hypothetical protein
MIFYDEIYYEITLKGTKSELKKFVDFLLSGGLDDYIEIDSEYIVYGDSFKQSEEHDITDISLVNEDGYRIDELDVDEFLEVFCKAAERLDIDGFMYDVDEEEFKFISEAGNDYYRNARDSLKFNDELDDIRDEEDNFDD